MEIRYAGTFDLPLIRQAVALTHRPGLNRRVLTGFLCVLLAAAAVGTVILLFEQPENRANNGLRLVLWLAALLYILLRPVWVNQRTAKRLWDMLQASPKVRGLITTAGVQAHFGKLELSLPWDQVARTARSPQLTTLLSRDGVMVVFPRAFFAAESDWDKLHQWLSEHPPIPQK